MAQLCCVSVVQLHHQVTGLHTVSQRDLAMFTNFEIDQPFIEEKILEYTLRRNYTSNRQAVYEAIRNAYTYWPDQRSDYHVRRMFLKVRYKKLRIAHKLHCSSPPMPTMWRLYHSRHICTRWRAASPICTSTATTSRPARCSRTGQKCAHGCLIG